MQSARTLVVPAPWPVATVKYGFGNKTLAGDTEAIAPLLEENNISETVPFSSLVTNACNDTVPPTLIGAGARGIIITVQSGARGGATGMFVVHELLQLPWDICKRAGNVPLEP